MSPYHQSSWGSAGKHIFALTFAFLRVVQAQYDPVNNFCKRLDHQSTLVNGTLYIDGGRETFTTKPTDPGPHVIGINEYLITVDMTTSWSVKTTVPIKSIPKPYSAPDVARAVMYADPSGVNDFYLFGGTVASDNTSFVGWQEPQPEGPALWSYKAATNSWTSFDLSTSNILRPCSGASAIIEDKGLVIYYNGEQDNGSSTQAQALMDTTKFLSGMVVLDLASHTAKNLSTAAVSGNARVRGGLVHIPLPSSDGILLLLAGGEKSADDLEHDWKGTLVTFDSVNVFDVGSLSQPDAPNGVWYSQSTSGAKPTPRVDPCFVVAAAPDNSSYNIYMYGGRDGVNAYYDELWILTLPSFQWVLASSGSSPRYSMTCHLATSRQMILVGGSNTSRVTDNCDPVAQGLVVLDLTEITWSTSFDAKASPYQVPAKVVKLVGGSQTGGATVNTPVGGFVDPNLGKLFHLPVSSSTNSTAQQPSMVPGKSSVKHKSKAGAIAGGIIATIAGIAVLTMAAMCNLRRRRQRVSQLQHQAHDDGKLGGSQSDLLDSNELYEIQGSTALAHEKEAREVTVELPAFSDHDPAKQHWHTPPTELIELHGSEPLPTEDQPQH